MDRQTTIDEAIEIPLLLSISSLNLRCGRKSMKTLAEPIRYVCSLCCRVRNLGKSAAVLSRLEYFFHGKMYELTLCDDCLDVFVDGLLVGPRIFRELSMWKVRSRVARISLVQERLICGRCLRRADTHMFVKYDDLSHKGKEDFKNLRACAQCVVGYLVAISETGCTKDVHFKRIVCAEKFEVKKKFGFAEVVVDV
jgi:hypothetical protein